LRQAVERHKARLQAEFTKARLRRQCGTVEEIKKVLAEGNAGINFNSVSQPRWVRANTLKSNVSAQLKSTFAGYKEVQKLDDVVKVGMGNVICKDQHVPDLLAIHPDASLVKTRAYLDGELILQDKASCFPAYLLLGNDDESIGDMIDGCAAPGNKTTHAAAILQSTAAKSGKRKRHIFACERDGRRSEILETMVEKAGASDVQVLAKQDFLALDPNAEQFRNVTHLLLDPSCSGSGIIGREDIPKFDLPTKPQPKTPRPKDASSSKKRKHDSIATSEEERQIEEDEQPNASTSKDPERLAKLASLQSKIVEHAFAFPGATRITYSTCSLHHEENEAVVSRVLASEVARTRGWRILPRETQPGGLREWPHRGKSGSGGVESELTLSEQQLEGCIRCYPGDEQGTMGFFVVCFVRDQPGSQNGHLSSSGIALDDHDDGGSGGEGEDEWDGFSD
jgi:25S rRNA (cytosine2278-C5)-methyltransferase